MLDWLNARLKRIQSRSEGGAIVPDEPAGAQAPADSPAPMRSPLALLRAGLLQEAEQHALSRLQNDPDDAESLYVQGSLALDRKQGALATTSFEKLVQARPDDVDAWVGAARARASAGRAAAAQAAFQRAREIEPKHPGLVAELALAARARGKPDEAAALLESSAGTTARSAEAHFQLGMLLLERKQAEAALRHLRRAIAIDSRHANAHANLGAMLRDQRQANEAAEHLERALQLAPTLSHAAYNLAMLRIDQRQWAAAADLLQQSLAANPKQADAQYWLGHARMGMGDAAESRKAYQAALRLDANLVEARWGFAMAQLAPVPMDAAEQQEGVAAFAREVDKLGTWFRTHRPTEGFRAVGAQQPYYLAYSEGDHRAVLAQYGQLCASLMAGWARKSGLKPPAPAVARSKQRIAIVSAHIHTHSVWNAVVRGWVEHLDPAQFEIELFHTGGVQDAETQWARKKVARLHQGLGHWSLWAKTIADGGFDVLIYPEIGMDATTVRLSALRLAPVQLASWGHPVTTGLPTIDGYLSADLLEPADAATHYSETLIRLPGLGCAYRPYGTRAASVDRARLGIERGDRLLLCAGVSFKYQPRDDALLVDIARRCRPCKLVFFREASDSKAQRLEQRLKRAFDAAGVPFDECVRIIPWQDQASFFGLLEQADVYIDTIGFSGFNTAMQAVECATPIVAWEGAFMRGRFASAILRKLGLDEWVASTPEAFAGCVEKLCMQPQLRAQVKAQITQRRAALYDDRASVDALARELQALRPAA